MDTDKIGQTIATAISVIIGCVIVGSVFLYTIAKFILIPMALYKYVFGG